MESTKSDAEISRKKGAELLAARRYEDALKAFETAIELDPERNWGLGYTFDKGSRRVEKN